MQRLQSLRHAIRRIGHTVRGTVNPSADAPRTGPEIGGPRTTPACSPAHTADGRARLDLAAFLATDFAGRIRLAHRLAGGRLFSNQLVEIWSAVLRTLRAPGAPEVEPETVARLQRELAQLHPPSKASRRALADYLRGAAAPSSSPPPIVHLIISCVPYLPKSRRLHEAISADLDPVHIVIGDPDLREATFDGPHLRVPAPDTYEALPLKVFESLVAVRRRYGQVGVMKIDDDCQPSGDRDPDAIVRALSELDYAGRPTGHRDFDRCWHIGKAADVHVPSSRRFRGKWAKGSIYYLGPKALEILVRDYLRFPDELAGEIYEDKLVGQVLRHHRIEPTRVDLPDLLGFTVSDDAMPEVPPFVVE